MKTLLEYETAEAGVMCPSQVFTFCFIAAEGFLLMMAYTLRYNVRVVCDFGQWGFINFLSKLKTQLVIYVREWGMQKKGNRVLVEMGKTQFRYHYYESSLFSSVENIFIL